MQTRSYAETDTNRMRTKSNMNPQNCEVMGTSSNERIDAGTLQILDNNK